MKTEQTNNELLNANFRLIAVAFVVVIGLMLFSLIRHQVALARRHVPEYLESKRDPLREPEVTAALENALQSHASVLFFHHNWSIYSEIGKRDYRRFIDQYCKKYPNTRVLFHEIDLSDVNHRRLFTKRPEFKEIRERAKMQLDGEIFWYRNGKFTANEYAYEHFNKDQSVYWNHTRRLER